jgi:glycosyltransferase involved in cell wall biosynthesis
MKRVLIISPNFPPINAADMHRVRQSLPFFEQMGWKATVLAVIPKYIEMSEDPILLKTIPEDTDLTYLKAFDAKRTRKFGLGNIGYRSLYYFRKHSNKLLKDNKFDLIYFSTTAFPVMTLGRYWKKKFGVPFIIDMQDPWRNDFYLDKPKSERPPKFLLAYNMDKYLEAWTMKHVDGIVSVSPGYPETLMERYPNIKPEDCIVIPFGGAGVDFEVLDEVKLKNNLFELNDGKINFVYIGRGGHDMNFALGGIFSGLKKGLEQNPELFSNIRMFFIGTSYAADGKGLKTITPIAEKYGVQDHVIELTNRLPYFEAMNVLKDADVMLIPGSTDTQYTASKLYPYILAKKPMMAVFNENSSVVEVLAKTNAGTCVTFSNSDNEEDLGDSVFKTYTEYLNKIPFTPKTNWDEFEPYSAREATRKQVDFFNKILDK